MATDTVIQDALSDSLFDAPKDRPIALDLAGRIRMAMKDVVNGKVVKTDEKVFGISDRSVIDIWQKFERDRSSEAMVERLNAAYEKEHK